MRTTLLRNGKIIDGTGSAAAEGHLLIEDDKISAVLKKGAEAPDADNVIDVAGCVISPGFIDMHSHSDWLMSDEGHPKLMKHFIEQGITTVVGGNCGFSPAPIHQETLEMLDHNLASMLADKPIDYTWESVGGFLDCVDETGPALNIAELVGHATVRIAASRTRRGEMPPEELNKCLDEVRRSFDEGACGLSFGLGYDPGMYSPIEELEAFSKVAAEAGKPITVHQKALSIISPTYPYTYIRPHNLRALKEIIDVAKSTGVKLQVSHLIYVGRRSWNTAQPSLEMIDQARKGGVDIMFDALPYMCGNTTINAVMPYWFLAMGERGYKSALARARLRAELEIGFRLVGFMYKDFQVMDAGIEGEDDLAGLRIDEVARRWNTSPFNALLKLSELSEGKTQMLFHTYSGEPGREEALEATLSHELCLFETDALVKSKGYKNPAALGGFPRILGEFVRERKLFSIENAVNRMTGASAERFGMKDRGVLAKGKMADIVIFDQGAIADTPPVGNQPAGKPKGIKHVFINGVHTLKEGRIQQGTRPGRVIRI